jgi:hypothetical protein
MAGYFVSGDPDLRMEAGLLAEELHKHWPTVRFLERDDEANTARWAVRMPSDRELYGELQSTGQAIELEGDVYDAAEFARWVRTQIPERIALYFFDEGYTNNLPVTAQTSTEELARPFVLQG